MARADGRRLIQTDAAGRGPASEGQTGIAASKAAPHRRREAGGKWRIYAILNLSTPSQRDGPLRSRAALQPASTPPPRSAPHPRRHSPCADLTAAAIRSAQERILSNAGPLLQAGKENPEPRNLHIFRLTAASAASTCRAAKQAAKAARKRPIQNPSLPRQRCGPRPAGCQRRNQHPRRPNAACPMLAQHLAPAPPRALRPIATLSQGCTPFQKLPPTAASQDAPAGRRPALAERDGKFRTP